MQSVYPKEKEKEGNFWFSLSIYAISWFLILVEDQEWKFGIFLNDSGNLCRSMDFHVLDKAAFRKPDSDDEPYVGVNNIDEA